MKRFEFDHQFWQKVPVFASQVNNTFFCTDSFTCDCHPSMNLIRNSVKYLTILECSWFSFIGITYYVFFGTLLCSSKFPFHTCRKSGATPAPKTRVEYLLNDLIFAHLEAFGKHFMIDRKSTRLNSSHANISYAVFCLKKKK